MSDDAIRLMVLQEAALEMSPAGHVKVSTLRTAIKNGRLNAKRIGKAYFVTRLDLQAYEEACRVKPKEPVSISGPSGGGKTSSATSQLSGSSVTDQKKLALAHLKKVAHSLS